MSVKSKSAVSSIATWTLLAIGYLIFAFSEHAPANSDLRAWALAMLIFIGIGVLAMILVQIFFRIVLSVAVTVHEKDKSDKNVEHIVDLTMAEDEMDSLISLKSQRASSYVYGLGFMGALLLLALGRSPLFALHVMLIAAGTGSIVEGLMNVYYYERGI